MLFGRKKRHINRILVVEDEPLVAFDTEHFLGASGFEICATVDTVAAACASIAAGDKLDLVLVDINLSDGSGLDVARCAHEHGVPVLLVTGSCPQGAQDFAAGCLAKPYPQKDLLSAIDAIDAVVAGAKLPRRLPSGFNLFRAVA
ncbi:MULTISPECIES: response regulator [unclassified Sphingomonas]|uniref:response regulator n=1 Tax=unclassified Sphingomonas TaxID=196159 RepID=UPI0006F839C2|nr:MULTISPECIES: response regulator [unclassified Sphingomonas]KQM28145.1 response regulator [Sphingomonas sp. Leaf9]KQM44487.1 response regulator [Sphingomonas sp. Leaf11]KQM85090.1 response regulator [Sphingomonas sp. Leaf23]